MGFTEQELETIQVAAAVSAGCSLLGSAFILAMYMGCRNLRGFAFKLVVYLTAAEIVKSIGTCYSAFLLPMYGTTCYIAAAGISYGSLSAVLWTTAIAWSLYGTVVRGKDDIHRQERYFHLFCWGLPMLLTPLPFSTGSYGYAQGWCWVQATATDLWLGTLWRLLVFYLPLWLVIPYNVYSYVHIIKAIRVHSSSGLIETIEVRDTLIRRLRFYPVILLLCHTPITVKRIIDFIDPSEANLSLSIISSFLICFHGFLNALVYGLTDSVKSSISHCLFPTPRSDSLLTDTPINAPRPISLKYANRA